MQFLTAIYHLALAFWVGGVALFTLVLTPILFRTQPRDLAGTIVGVLFPGYFRWGVGCGGVALLCLLILRDNSFLPALLILLLMLAATLFQALFIEPKAKGLKLRIGSFENTTKDHPLRKEFSKLHGISAVCNLAVLVGGVVLVVFQ
jgi:Domain of unknown function (DUF4149)